VASSRSPRATSITADLGESGWALSLETYQRARSTRDARFDGKFFIGVLTTGIYCRPICPAQAPKEKNIRYFPTAAAAAEAGLRPCLRCRPETSPGTPAWMGSSTTVSRALRLIGECALDDSGVEELAQRLGLSSRQLRRLFQQHLGASPITVAQTRRVHFAKRLMDETGLPLAEIAFASGFRSVRQFNDVFRTLYGRPPRELRRKAIVESPGAYTFRLSYRPPYAWDAVLRFLEMRAIPDVELVHHGQYGRTFVLDGIPGRLFVGKSEVDALTLRVQYPEPSQLFRIVERVRRMFDLGADPEATHDHRMRPLLERLPGLRVPGAWDGFELTVRAILGQQVSVAAATTMSGRIARSFGVPVSGGDSRLFPDAALLAQADLTTIGLTRQRAATIQELAARVATGEIRFDAPVDGLRQALLSVRGIGPWTVEYVAMRALGEPDAFPDTDLALRKAIPDGLLERSAEWRPWRAYAAMYLWMSL
jgi:AraC family transcriptional regulator, regulatory protein of adaptative response / DNA-3-methyladenine glycosylase II